MYIFSTDFLLLVTNITLQIRAIFRIQKEPQAFVFQRLAASFLR